MMPLKGREIYSLLGCHETVTIAPVVDQWAGMLQRRGGRAEECNVSGRRLEV